MSTLCLTMIVKDEVQILKRCFDSVIDYIDYWVISDTGSTDGTIEFIKNYFNNKNIPGELHHDKWVNFGHNRTLSLNRARNKADYLLLMDADFVLKVNDTDFKSKLSLDGYQIRYEGVYDYRQMLLVKSNRNWEYVGVTHEYIKCDDNIEYGNINGIVIDHIADGNNKTAKDQRDVDLLLKGLEQEPDNGRYMFFLANGYRNLQDYDNAIKYYEERLKKGGWDEEIYLCLYSIACCKMEKGEPFNEYGNILLQAHSFRPIRLEALYLFVLQSRLNGIPATGVTYGINAINTPYPINDVLFVNRDIHQWVFLEEIATCLMICNEHVPALNIYKFLGDNGLIPEIHKEEYMKKYQMFIQEYELHNNQLNNINQHIDNLNINTIRPQIQDQREDKVNFNYSKYLEDLNNPNNTIPGVLINEQMQGITKPLE